MTKKEAPLKLVICQKGKIKFSTSFYIFKEHVAILLSINSNLKVIKSIYIYISGPVTGAWKIICNNLLGSFKADFVVVIPIHLPAFLFVCKFVCCKKKQKNRKVTSYKTLRNKFILRHLHSGALLKGIGSGKLFFVKNWVIELRWTSQKIFWLGTFFGSVLTIFISFSGSVLVYS